MTESMGDILAKRKIPKEPPEFQQIRQFVLKRFNSTVSLKNHDHSIIIKVDNASLAGALRMELHVLQELCQTNKKLVIRIY